jgi:ACS family tartrate transporter-like MFS transporter
MMSAATASGLDIAEQKQAYSETDLESAMRKNTWRLLPVLVIAYFFNYIDRTSVGFAALQMNKDIGLTATQFGWGAGIMFFSYCLLEVPSNLAMYRFGARKWIARIMITWGLAAAATALAVGPISFYVIRFLLGVFEAGFFPGVIWYLSIWYPSNHRTKALAWFMAATPLSSVVGGPAAVSLLAMDGILGLAGWQWMFLVLGLPATFLGVLCLWRLADEPKDATWLTSNERSALIAALGAEKHEKPKKDLLGALKDVRVLILTGITFCFTIGSYGVGIWLPLILKGHNLSNMEVGFISAIPYVFATIGMLAWAALVSRTGQKILNLVLALLLGAAGLVLSVVFPALIPAIIALSLALVGTISARTIFYTIPQSFLTGAAAAGGLAFINSVGAAGGFVGPTLVGWLKDATGSYSAGMLGLAAVLGISVLLAASLKLVIKDQ